MFYTLELFGKRKPLALWWNAAHHRIPKTIAERRRMSVVDGIHAMESVECVAVRLAFSLHLLLSLSAMLPSYTASPLASTLSCSSDSFRRLYPVGSPFLYVSRPLYARDLCASMASKSMIT